MTKVATCHAALSRALKSLYPIHQVVSVSMACPYDKAAQALGVWLLIFNSGLRVLRQSLGLRCLLTAGIEPLDDLKRNID